MNSSSNAPLNELQTGKDRTVIKHAPGWKHEQASESEANVKADREPHPRNIEHLQNETIDHLHGDGDTLLKDMKEKAQAVGRNVAKASKECTDKVHDMGEGLSKDSRQYLNKANKEAKNLGEMASKQAEGGQGRKWTEQIKDEAENAKLSGEGYVDRAKTQAKEMRDKNLSPESKEYAYKVKEEVKQSGDLIMDGVKTGAQKMSALLKESMETAKKAVGMDK